MQSKIILSRIMTAIPTLIGIVIVTFALTRMLPGDPAAYFAGPAATPASIEETRVRLGLDKTIVQQFVFYIEGLLVGELGNSLTSGQRVIDDIRSRLPASLELTFGALLLSSMVGIPLGIAAALKPSGWLDQICSVVSTLGQAIPTFFLGLLLVYFFYYLLGWAPAPLGRLEIFYSSPNEVTGFWLIDSLLEGDVDLFMGVLSQLILPMVTLALFGLGPLARITRAAMLEVLSRDYVRTARAMGLSKHKVLWRYTFRNAVIPVLNASGIVFSFMLGASVLVEKVFGWPGIGAYAIDAVLASDFAPIQGFILTMGFLYLGLNLVIDIAISLLNPEVRFDN